MKLIEAMKNGKTIEKRILKNCEQITQYAAWVNDETPVFETEEKQRAEVQSLIQANLDLEKEYLRLKVAVETTNLATKVTIGTFTYTITELLTLKDRVSSQNKIRTPGAASFRVKTYLALNPEQAIKRLQMNYKQGVDATNPPKVIRAYKEEDKNKALREWEEFVSAIDGKLEVVNAETDLLGYDTPAVKAA